MKLLKFTFFFLFIFISNIASADIIKLDDGSFLEGRIVETTDNKYIIQEKGGGKCTLSKKSVVSVKKQAVIQNDLYNTRDIYVQKLKGLIIDDADSQMELAEWCFKNKLFGYAQEHYQIAATLDISLKSDVDNRLKIIEGLKVEKANSDIQALIDSGQFLLAENLILDIIKRYPDADGTKLTQDQLIQIWGNKKAKELIENSLEAKDTLPPVAPDIRNLGGIIEYLDKNNMSIDNYFNKCLKKGDDFAVRAEEMRRNKTKEKYIDTALYCYYLVAYGAEDNSKSHRLALDKAKKLCDEYNIDNYEEKFLNNLRR
jgi:hypothetical protein